MRVVVDTSGDSVAVAILPAALDAIVTIFEKCSSKAPNKKLGFVAQHITNSQKKNSFKLK